MRTPRSPLALGVVALVASVVGGTPGGVVAQGAAGRGWVGMSLHVETTMSSMGGQSTTVLIRDVSPGSPAWRAGVRAGDVLLSIDGHGPEDGFGGVTQSVRAGDSVTVVVSRNGEQRSLGMVAATRPDTIAENPPWPSWTLALGGDSMADLMFRAMDSLRVRLIEGGDGMLGVIALPDPREAGARERSLLRSTAGEGTEAFGPRTRDSVHVRLAPADGLPFPFIVVQGDDSAAPRSTETGVLRPLAPYVLGENRAAGAQVVELRPELAEYFQVRGGVLVTDVAPGTPAALAGIQPGDVLTRVAGAAIRNIQQLRLGLSRAGTSPLSLTLVRKGRTLEVTLPR